MRNDNIASGVEHIVRDLSRIGLSFGRCGRIDRFFASHQNFRANWQGVYRLAAGPDVPSIEAGEG